jgi:steroid delta-isomerase-like uncharacterized protein
MLIDIENMIKNYYEAWNSCDVNKLASFFTEDGVYEDVASGVTIHGKEELKDLFRKKVFKLHYFRSELKSFFFSGNYIAHEWILVSTSAGSPSGTGTNSSPPVTGTSVSIRGVSITELDEGKIKRNRTYEIFPVQIL